MVFLFVMFGLCAVAALVAYGIFEIQKRLNHLIALGQCDGSDQTPRRAQAPSGERPRMRHVKSPPVFRGDTREFKEWAFAIELAMKSLQLDNAEERLSYAASFLEGNARLWFIAYQEANTLFSDWPDLKSKLGEVFGPVYDREQARIDLFALHQDETLDEYINKFSRLSLQVPELDDHSRAILFTRGLAQGLSGEVLREHPQHLAQAIRAAVSADQSMRLAQASYAKAVRAPGHQRRQPGPWSSQPTPSGGREPREPEGRSRLCFTCRKPDHIARFCPEGGRNATSKPSLNDGRQ